MKRRSAGKVLGDLLDAADAAEELVGRGRAVFDEDRLLRLAAEAVIGRIGDAAEKLLAIFGDDLPLDVPWREVVGNRIVVDHAYHRVDYEIVWASLVSDVPAMAASVTAWAAERGIVIER